jgi:hypothetical protein
MTPTVLRGFPELPTGFLDALNRNFTAVAGDTTPLGLGVDYAFLPSDRIDSLQVNATAAARTITLPPPSGNRRRRVVKTDSSANTVTIAPSTVGQLINGLASYVLYTQYESVELEPTGTGWLIVSGAASSPIFSSLRLWDTNASHYTTLSIGSDLTSNRTLSLVTGDANRVITLSGNPTLADWFDQSVKVTSSPTFAAVTATTFTGALVGNASTATALQTGRTISLTGDVTYTSPAFDGTSNVTAAATLATVNGNIGTFGSATQASVVTTNAKGLITAISNATITPAIGSITGLGTGIAAALAINVGTVGAPVLFNGALGTPSSGTATNLTGTSGITGVGALNSGSITSGFGSIDVGADSITGGAISGTTGGFSGLLSLTGAAERQRIIGDDVFLSFYNTGNTTRTGYIQFNSAGSTQDVVIASSINAPIKLFVNAGQVASFTTTGLAVTGTLGASGNFGVNGSGPIAKPTVSGSRGGNAALASLLTAMANYGLITDSTTA